VYPAERDAGDASEVAGELRTNVEKLPHPLRSGDADVQYIFRVEVQNFSAPGQRRAAGHRPRGGKAVFGRQFAEAAREGATEKIAHALHRLIVVA
jgi:hypothetical protein